MPISKYRDRMSREEQEILKEIEEARKRRRKSNVTGQVNSQGDVLWEAREMRIDDFFDYIRQLNASTNMESRLRADKLLEEYKRWRQSYGEEEAIKKAFASVQVKQAHERIKELRTSGASNERIQRWEDVKGHALTQHQKPGRFWRRLRAGSSQRPPDPVPVPPPPIPPDPVPVPPDPVPVPPRRRKGLPPASSFTLTVDSTPIQGITFELDDKRFITTKTFEVTPGNHTVTMPWQYQDRSQDQNKRRKIYTFQHWEDYSKDPQRTIEMNRDRKIVATYKVVEARSKLTKLVIESYPMLKVPIDIFKIVTPGLLKKEDFEAYIRKIIRGDDVDEIIRVILAVFDAYKSQKFSDEKSAYEWLIGQFGLVIDHPAGLASYIVSKDFIKKEKDIKGAKEDLDFGNIQGSGRWRPRGSNLLPIAENFKTAFYIDLDSGKYIIHVPAKHDGFDFKEWHIYRPSAGQDPLIFSVEGPQSADYNLVNDGNVVKIKITLNEPLKMVAYYHKTASHTRQPGLASPYRSGMSPGEAGGEKDLATSALSIGGIRRRFSREVTPRKLKTDPYLLAAINKGKRILNGYAKAEYSRLFNPLRAEYTRRGNQLRLMARTAENARRELRRIIRQNARHTSAGRRAMFMRSHEDTINLADELAAPNGQLAGNVALMESRDRLREYMEARDKYYADFKRDLESASAQLFKYMEDKAGIVAVGLARRARMALSEKGHGDAGDVETELREYARSIAEDYATRGRTIAFKMLRGIGMVSRSLETGGAVMQNLMYNTVTFIFGPWTIMTILALVHFFFVLSYVGYNIQILWIMPAIAALLTWLLNFENSFKPLDWVTHLSSGAVIGFSAALFLISLGAQNWTFIGISGTNSLGFWIAWGFLGFLGLFQFYNQGGGHKTILTGSLIILVFAYLAMGPYQAYFHTTVDQVRAPVEIAYHSVSGAVTDVWLLATNPTEWYARQQLVNVRPERPLDYPKGIELASIDALPPSVPAGQPFALTTVIRNDGILMAQDVTVSVGCNQWCTVSSAKPTQIASYQSLKGRIDGGTLAALDGGHTFYIRDNLTRGESEIITITPLSTIVFETAPAQTNFAKITYNLSYAYSTRSSLQVDIINNDELQKRFRQGDTVFKQVLAVDKGTPARLSLNVGPQPLKENSKDNILLVSVSNTRDKSKVMLPRGSIINISLPRSIGSNLRCGEHRGAIRGNYEVIEYRVQPGETSQPSIEILPYEFNSIYAFICNFDAAPSVDILRSDFITAEIHRYVFRIEQEKDIPVTPPLGVIFEPFAQECSRCGQQGAVENVGDVIRNAADLCQPSECNQITTTYGNPSDPKKTCYYEYAGKTISSLVGHPCKVCGTASCGKFLAKESCEQAVDVCHFSCKWVPGESEISPGVKLEGKCVQTVPEGGLSTGRADGGIVGVPSGLTQEVIDSYLRNHAQGSLSRQAPAFYSLGQRYDIDPSFGVAVAMHESGAGTSRLAVENNNYFGISNAGEGSGFRSFSTPADGIEEFYRLISQNYVTRGQDTPGEIACAPDSGVTSHCYVVGGRAAWVENVPRYRQAVLDMRTTTPDTTPITPTTETCTSCTSKNMVWCQQVNPEKPGPDAICEKTTGDCFNKMETLYDIYKESSKCPAPLNTTSDVPKTCQECQTKNMLWCTNSNNPSSVNGVCDTSVPNCNTKMSQPITAYAPRDTCPVAKGDPNYCQQKLAGNLGGGAAVCKEGEGGCQTEAECENVATGSPAQRLTCRKGLVPNVGICCFPQDSNNYCLGIFNTWKQS